MKKLLVLNVKSAMRQWPAQPSIKGVTFETVKPRQRSSSADENKPVNDSPNPAATHKVFPLPGCTTLAMTA